MNDIYIPESYDDPRLFYVTDPDRSQITMFLDGALCVALSWNPGSIKPTKRQVFDAW